MEKDKKANTATVPTLTVVPTSSVPSITPTATVGVNPKATSALEMILNKSGRKSNEQFVVQHEAYANWMTEDYKALIMEAGKRFSYSQETMTVRKTGLDKRTAWARGEALANSTLNLEQILDSSRIKLVDDDRARKIADMMTAFKAKFPEGKIQISTLLQTKPFQQLADDLATQATVMIPRVGWVLSNGVLACALPYSQASAFMFYRWKLVTAFFTKMKTADRLVLITTKVLLGSSWQVTPYLKVAGVFEKFEYDSSFGTASLISNVETLTLDQLINSMMAVDIRHLTQNKEIKLDREGAAAREVIGAMIRIIKLAADFGLTVKMPKQFSLLKGSEFNDSYFSALRFWTASVRHAKGDAFGRKTGANGRLGFNSRPITDADKEFDLF